MRISTRGRYAVMALVELAAREATAPAPPPGRRKPPVSLAEIAASQMLSLAYLEQLFGPLRRAGLVTSTRGPGGGYRLVNPPQQITVASIIEAVEEPYLTRTEGSEALTGEPCRTERLWQELDLHVQHFLEGISVADVLHGRVSGRAGAPLPALKQELPERA
ncbi:Rrf2 family transcriptional regulator [Rhodovarius lipocyclicus]|jgi:Rrf2 family iron-sulfur cluster assembly transcriptional regulator|uniref:Rrf2 family transcriptional regulator n=1 Tax=Rhodovarius lipocyclicus TaxID=268410 RepID=UPI00135B68FE|nr:Rrf2 family transcriptional regulator [Rhodovarius lipocyclicus]